MAQMRFFNEISKLQPTGLSKADILEIRLKLVELKNLERLIHRTKRPVSTKSRRTKLAAKTKSVADNICWICKQPKPHIGKEAVRKHMWKLSAWHVQRHAAAYWQRVGYDTLWKASVRVRKLRAIERRTAIFKEIAPRSGAIMSNAEIAAIIDQCRPGKTRWLNNIEEWKTWVRRRYA